MIRLVLALSIFSLVACFESHDAGMQEIRGEDCVLCHADTFASGSAQDHHASLMLTSGEVVPTTCQDCHNTKDWTQNLGFHPKPMTFVDAVDPTKNETFLLSSHPTTKCLQCHDLDVPEPDPVTRGYNTGCIKCHPNDDYHQQAHFMAVTTRGGQSFTYTSYAENEPNFCRTCHPEGLANKHPWDRFPQHHGASCTECHKASRGPNSDGANTSCIECHEHANEDRHHDEGEILSCYQKFKTTPPAEPNRQLTQYNFCLHCHPDGKRKLKICQ